MSIVSKGLEKELKMTKKRTIFGMLLLMSCAAQAATVLWDGTSADITGLTSTIKTTPNIWDASDEVWNTTDEVIAEVGSQAAFKSAISQAGTAQRSTGEINHGADRIFVGGGNIIESGTKKL